MASIGNIDPVALPQYDSATPVGLYIHFPYCQQKCIYCDFYSIVNTAVPESFLSALQGEMQLWNRYVFVRKPKIATIFFGGGTPSLLTEKQLISVARIIEATFDLSDLTEWTIECNPESVTASKLRTYRAIGINRISFGVQSLRASELHFLHRIHTAEKADAVVRLAQHEGFTNINVDLIFGLPNQKLADWDRTLRTVLSWQVPHISAYALTYESGTPLYRLWKVGKLNPLSDDAVARLFTHTHKVLSEAGYHHYEISNYALPNHQCKHNMNYWQRGEYLAFGPSAHGHYRNVRYSNVRNITQYFQSVASGTLPVRTYEKLDSREIFEEIVYLGLRSSGIPVDKLIHFAPASAVQQVIQQLLTLYPEYFVYNNATLTLTSDGYVVADYLILKFLELWDTAFASPHSLPVLSL